MGIATDEPQVSDVGPKVIYRARAQSLIGLAAFDTNVVEDFDEYIRHSPNVDGTLWSPIVAGSGTALGDFTQPGGVARLFTGATANSQRESFGPGGVSNTKTKLWYFATRFKLPTGFDALGRAYFGFRTADLVTESLVVGGVGSVDTANLVLQYGGIFATSKLVLGALDTNFHIVEAWNGDRNSYSARVDGGAILNVIPAAGLTAGGGTALARGAINGATATNREIAIDWHYYLGERS